MAADGPSSGRANGIGRPRRAWPSLLLAMIAGVAPVALLLWISRDRAEARAAHRLREVVDAAVGRIDRVFGEADGALNHLAEQTGGVMDDQTVARLQRIVYVTHWFREAGLVDSRANLVCTNLGPVDPPVPVAEQEKSDPRAAGMQIVGVVDTEIMKSRSIILARPTIGEGEVNLLLDPTTLTEVFEQFPLGPGGSARIAMANGHTLAQFGSGAGASANPATSPATRPVADADTYADTLAVDGASERFGVRVQARIGRDWALREWYADLKWMTPLGIASGAALGVAAIALSRRPGSMRDDLRRALRRGEFEAHYQPTMDIASGRCTGAEALIRWRHPVEGLVRPDIFIGVAEESGLIGPITEWLIDRVAKDLSETLRTRSDLHIGVNLAPEYFNSRHIVETLPRLLKPYQFPAARLLLELTERGMIGEDVELSRGVIDDLRAMGLKIALDDFGTGFSSLAYLHTFKFDALKIDASFVRRIGTDSVSAGVIDAIIELGHALKVRMIAEGVERPQQLEFLRTRGVHAVQGWIFAKAMPVNAFLEFERRTNAQRT